MTTKQSFDRDIYRAGFWSVIAAFVLAVCSAFFPLDVPGGYGAEHADRVTWLAANGGAFITAWAIQIAWMTAWTATFFVLAWKVAAEYPLRAIVSAMFVLVSFVAFIIPKFMAVWTIPQLGDAVAGGAVGAEMADSLLLVLNVSIPFSLYTSFDYLGFWMYAIFSVLTAVPLFRISQGALSLKISAVSLGAFGVGFHAMMIGVFMDAIPATNIEQFTGPFFLLILIGFGAAGVHFKGLISK